MVLVKPLVLYVEEHINNGDNDKFNDDDDDDDDDGDNKTQ